MAIDVPPPGALPVAAPSRAVGVVSLAMLVVSIAFAVAGQLTLKSAMTQVGRIGRAQVRAPAKTVVRAAKEPRLWIGLALFGISAAFWLVVLSRVPLSVAYPLVGLSYVLVVLLSRLLFHEQVPAMRWAGVVVIALGIALVGMSYRTISGT